MAPRILLTNDDGIHSLGLGVLRRAVDGIGEIAVIAPARNNSGVARAITIGRPLRLRPSVVGDGWPGFACDGTPSDCVRVGALGVAVPSPTLVVSGINLGANMGTDVTYSGTVGAALEAALRGVPAVAFSVEEHEPGWLDEAQPIVRALVLRVIDHGLPPHSILNVNIPDRPLADIKGIRPARLAGASCYDKVVLDVDGDRGSAAAREHLLPSDWRTTADWADTDFETVDKGFVAVTPMRYDLLDAALLAGLSSWDFDLDAIRAAAP